MKNREKKFEPGDVVSPFSGHLCMLIDPVWEDRELLKTRWNCINQGKVNKYIVYSFMRITPLIEDKR